MEGLPRMPMLSVELKFSPTSTDFGPKFKEYIARAYEEGPDSYEKEIDELNQLRENAIKAPADFTGCSTLKKYFAQLYLLMNRFPMEENDSAAVPFTWYEKFSDMPSPATYEDARYELACVLHNIGAVHSYLASIDSRLTFEGMKVSCTHFQCASWTFQVLRDNAEPYRFSASSFSPDFDQHIMDWYSILMLAQAQECILEKSLVDNRKAHIIAKVAAQVAEFYAQAMQVLEQPSVSDIVGSSKCKSWRKFVVMKQRFYRAVAYYEMGCQSGEEQQMGERLAYFQAASAELAEAAKYGHKDSSESILQSLQFAEDVIVGRLTQAQKDNDFIYHEKVPSVDSLSELKGAPLVKPILFDPLNVDVSGGDIFKRLIPLHVHHTSSLYSEEKAKLLRRISDEVDVKNAALEDFMDSLKMDQLMLDVDFSRIALPETLIERCAAMNAKPTAVTDLLGHMSKLTSAYESVENRLVEIDKQIDLHQKETKDILAQVYGVAACDDENGTKVPADARTSIVARLKAFRDDFDRCRRANEQATKANEELHKALRAHSENLHTLSLPLAELKKQLPSPPSDIGSLPETTEMKRLLAKVDEMKRQRDALMDQLRDQIRDDDITKILLAAGKDKDEQAVFANEVKKHEKQIGIIEQNLSAQENIVKALVEANAKYGDIRQQINAATKRRDAKIRSLVATYDVYSDLEPKTKEGVEFYDKLKKSLDELDASLSKWSDAEFHSFCAESKATLDRKAAALEAQKQLAASTSTAASNSSIVNEPSGPKLKDYMAYYRAKKSGQAAAFPPTAANNNSNMTYPQVAVSGVPGSAITGVSFPPSSYTAASLSSNGFHNRGVGGDPIAHQPAPVSSGPMYDTQYAMSSGTFPTSAAYTAASSAMAPHHTSVGMNGAYMTPVSTVAANSGYNQYAATGSYGGGGGGTFTISGSSGPNNMAVPVGTISQGYFQQHQQITSSNVPNTAMQNYYHSSNMATSGFSGNMIPNQSSQMYSAPMQTQQSFQSSGYPVQPISAAAPQPMTAGYVCNTIFLETVAFGSNYVQLRWRYDGPKPAKYMITFRGFQHYDAGMGRFEEREVDTGAPIKLDVENYIVYNLHPDTTYAFEVSVIDEASGRIFVKSQSVRVNTNSSLL